MRRTVFLLLTLALLTVPVCAVQLPGELLDALPEEAAALAEGEGITEEGVQLLVQSFFDALRASLDRSLRGAVLLALTVLLTGAADGFASSLGENASRFVPLVGVLCVTTLSAGDLSSLIGLGTATMQDLADLTKLLLPTMAAALAGCGGVFTASAWQVGTLFAADALTTLIHELLLPLVYCHIALASAGAALPESGLDKLADGLEKLISWLLCGAVTAFTLYPSVSGVLTGSADPRGGQGGADGGLRRGAGGREHSRGVRRDGAQRGPFAARGHRGGRRAGRAARLPRAARAAERAVFALPRGGLRLGGQRRQAA